MKQPRYPTVYTRRQCGSVDGGLRCGRPAHDDDQHRAERDPQDGEDPAQIYIVSWRS